MTEASSIDLDMWETLTQASSTVEKTPSEGKHSDTDAQLPAVSTAGVLANGQDLSGLSKRLLVGTRDVAIDIDCRCKDLYETIRIPFTGAHHYPIACTKDWVDRPHRPGPVRILTRCVQWPLASLSCGQVACVQNNKRMFDAGIRKSIMSDLSRITRVPQPRGHSHPAAASERTSVTVAFNAVVRAHGLQPYVVSACGRDHACAGERAIGCRLPYFGKDLTESQLYMDEVQADSCILMVDVDYYTHMPTWLSYGRPILVYTMVAARAADKYVDGICEIRKGKYIDPAGRASYMGTIMHNVVHGGAEYHHPLWDYSADSFSAIDRYGNCLTYLVEQRQCPSGRWIVGLFPASSVAFPFWKATPLSFIRRFECLAGNYPVIEREDGIVSVGCPGTFETLEMKRLDYLAWVVKAQSVGLKNISNVEKWMAVSGHAPTREARVSWGPIIHSLLSQGWAPTGYGRVTKAGVSEFVEPPPLPAVDHYVCDHPSAPGDTISGNEIAVTVAPALVTNPTPVPARTMANAATAHQVRVKNTQDKFRHHVFKADLVGYAAEFTRLVVGEDRGTVSPLTIDELSDRWTRPSQRQTIENLHTFVQPSEETRVMRGFMKAETGAKPRQIVNCDGDHNAPLGCYTLALMDHLKCRHAWVGCGRTPEEIEERVNLVSTGLCMPEALFQRFGGQKLTTAHEEDITNCDGSEKRWHRDYVIDPILMGLTEPHARNDLRKLLKQEFAGFRVKMAEGYSYVAGWELISGTSATTLKNILKVAFGDYVALRRCGLSPAEAFAVLGVYCGDDGVSVALPLPRLAEARVAAMFDLAMDQKLIVRTSPQPVTFLGEYHYGAFFDGGQRLPDFWRQAQKCHISCCRGIPLTTAAANKAAGALAGAAASDPLLGPWFTKLLLLSGDVRVDFMDRETRYKFETDRSERSYASRLALREEIVDQWCIVTGVEQHELEDILAQIDRATCVEELPSGVLDNTLIAKQLLPCVTSAGSEGLVQVSNAPDESANDKNKAAARKDQESRRAPKGARRPDATKAQARPERKARNPVSRGGHRTVQPGRPGRAPA
nr:MAG: RNA-dependent RNA polymerase [Chemarfal virus 10]